MIVALSIVSDSGDRYLELYENKSAEEILADLRLGEDSYYGCTIEHKCLNATKAEEQALVFNLRAFEEESWNFE